MLARGCLNRPSDPLLFLIQKNSRLTVDKSSNEAMHSIPRIRHVDQAKHFAASDLHTTSDQCTQANRKHKWRSEAPFRLNGRGADEPYSVGRGMSDHSDICGADVRLSKAIAA